MSKKRKSLASFGEVANTNNNDVNDNDNVNDNNNVNVNKENKKSVIDEFLEVKPKKVMKPTGIYFDADVLRVLDELATKGGRGAKSKIVNDAVKKLFQEKNLL